MDIIRESANNTIKIYAETNMIKENTKRLSEIGNSLAQTEAVADKALQELKEIVKNYGPLSKKMFECCNGGGKPEVTDFVTPTQVKPKEITQLEASAPSITTKVADKSLNARETKAEVMPPQTRQDRNVVDGDKK